MARIAFVLTTCHEFEGVKVLSSVLKKHGHQTDCFITSEERDYYQAVRDFEPDVVGIYATSGQEKWPYPYIRRWKKELPHLKVVMGGPHPSHDLEPLYERDVVDATTKGEAEYAILELVEAWAAGRSIREIPNVGWLGDDGKAVQNPIRQVIGDLDSLPFPDVDVFYKYAFLRNKRVMQVHASRGCQNSCTYCSVGLMKKEWISGKKGEKFNRVKSVDYLCEEMNDIVARYPGFRMVNFGDAALNMERGWVQEFAEKWPKRVGLPFACNININHLNEDDIIAMKRAGCVSVQFGLESGSERVRVDVYRKGYTDKVVYGIPPLLRKHKLTYRTNNIMGSPAETLEDMFETARVNKRIKPNGCTVLIYRAFKSTVLGQEDYALGRVDLEKDIGPSIQQDSHMKREDVAQVVNLQKLFNLAVYMPGGETLVRQLIKLPRNRVFDLTQLSFLWYQHAVVSGYGMLDDFVLGLKNVGNVFAHTKRRQAAAKSEPSFLAHMDIGTDATL
ncbi:MAG: B12-binding domain-containing radical SAM protein [Planctomycetes bacterium]|nr:B12-binding domain-containing radical SAM protein [Planctomycetota bacterium]